MDLCNRGIGGAGVLQKLRNTAGESLVESLLGVMLACLAFVFLCSAVVVAARVNATAADADKPFALSSFETGQTVDVAFSVQDDLSKDYDHTYGERVLMTSQDQEYVYYD